MTTKPKPPIANVTVRTVGDRAALVARKQAKQAHAAKTWGQLDNKEKDALLRILAEQHGLVK